MSNYKYKYDLTLTKFLDFEEQKEIQRTLVKGSKLYFEGGYETAERKRRTTGQSEEEMRKRRPVGRRFFAGGWYPPLRC